MTITPGELAWAMTCPDFMQIMMNYHTVQAAMADSIGEPFQDCVKHHDARKEEFRVLRDKLNEEL